MVQNSEMMVFEKIKNDYKKINRNGLSDWWVYEDRWYCDEVKTGNQLLSREQEKFCNAIVASGGRYRLWMVDERGKSKVLYNSDINGSYQIFKEKWKKVMIERAKEGKIRGCVVGGKKSKGGGRPPKYLNKSFKGENRNGTIR